MFNAMQTEMNYKDARQDISEGDLHGSLFHEEFFARCSIFNRVKSIDPENLSNFQGLLTDSVGIVWMSC